MFVRPKSFARQMACLKMLGYQGLSLREAMPYIKGEKQGKVVVITFDDGFRNVFETAAPILRQYGFTATNFIVSNQIGGSNVWDQSLGIVETPCMDIAQLKEWLRMGHEIGSHTLDHAHLNRVPDDEAERQINESRAALEHLLDTRIESFAYPFGEESALHRRLVRDAGYRWAVTVERGNAWKGDDLYGLPRKTIRRSDTLLHFLRRVLA